MTGPAPDAAPGKAAKGKPRLAPVDLDIIKDDLGIDPADTSHDEWLQRRVDGLWSRFQTYTGRMLVAESAFVDDWGELVVNGVPQLQPPALVVAPRGSVFLRVFPVASITKLTVNGADMDASKATVDRASGKLLSLDGPPVSDLAALLIAGTARIEYLGGFDEVPAVLYEALIGALGIQWSARQATQDGMAVGGFLPRRISTIDVGDVELSMAPNALVEATMKSGGTADPLLGPYTTLLDEFVDYRSIISATAQPTTRALP